MTNDDFILSFGFWALFVIWVLSFAIVDEPLNSILIFGCYTGSKRGKVRDVVRSTRKMGSIDKELDEIYNGKGGFERNNGGAGRLISGQTDNNNQRYQKVGSLTSFLVFLSPACLNGQQKNRETTSMKGGGSIGVVYRD